MDKVIQEYNKYHGREAQVKLLEHKPQGKKKGCITVRFEGPYCLSCAPDEYHTDFQVLLEEKTGIKFQVNMMKQEEKGAVVSFQYAERKPAAIYISRF